MSDFTSYSNLHNTIVSFFDELVDMFPKEGDFVALRIMIKDQIPVTQLVKHFKSTLLPEKELVKTRNKTFFDKNVLFTYVGEAHSQKFKKLFHGLDDEDQESIWKWLDAFVMLTEKC
jgi:hypothetical protein